MQHYCGVPERIFEKFPTLKDDSMLVTTYQCDHLIDIWEENPAEKIIEGVIDVFGKEGSNPADVIYVYDEEEEEEDDEEQVK